MDTADVTQLTKIRGNAKGQVTRCANSLHTIKAKPLSEYDETAIDRLDTSVSKADANFQDAHHAWSLCDLSPRDAEKRDKSFHSDLEEHLLAVDAAKRDIRTIRQCIEARESGSKVTQKIKRLQVCLHRGYNAGLSEQYTAIEHLLDSHESLLAKSGVGENPGILEVQRTIMREWDEVIQARTDSGYAPPAALSAAMAAAPPPVHSGGPRSAHLPVVLPTFGGKTTEFKTFKRIFIAVMARQRHLNEEEKKAHLLKCMEQPRAKELARQAINQGTTMDDALTIFSRHYENSHNMVAFHLNQYFKLPTISQTKKDLMEALRYLSDHADGIIEAGCITSGQLLVAFMDGQFTKELRTLWRATYRATDKPPDVAQLREFLVSQEDSASDILVTRPGAPSQNKTSNNPQSRSQGSRQKSSPKTYGDRRVKQERSPSPSHSPPPRAAFVATRTKNCPYCKEGHSIFGCTAFKAKAPQERQEWAKEQHRCFNCLGDRHMAPECKSSKKCQECNTAHHTLLHLPAWKRSTPQAEANDYVATSVSARAGAPITAIAQVSAGKFSLPARLLLDTGAEVSLVSKEFATSIRARKLQHPPMKIGGVGSVISPYAVKISLHGDPEMGKQDETVVINARVLDHLPQPTSTMPKRSADTLSFLDDVYLADPDYGPGERIDMILDNSAWYFCRTGEVRKSRQKGIIADSTIFGWVVGGNTLAKTVDLEQNPQVLVAQPSDERLNRLLEQQWTDPELPGDSSELSLENAQAEAFFQHTHRQLPDGRHEVGMPPIENPPPLGESRPQAVRRYRSVHKSLTNKGQWPAYHSAVKDFIDTGHAELVPPVDLSKPPQQTFYMPMHAVAKSSSTSTKLRPVCDASARSSTGYSYNDTLATGPCNYHPLPSILTTFRDAAVGMTADVSKMYRQVSLRLEDRDFHRFLFELEPGHLADYRMTRVTFGVKSSPFVATRVLQQIAQDQQLIYPRASKVIRSSFYVDDVLTGATTVDEALAIREELNQILDTGKMPLCKWRSNSCDLLNSIPSHLREHSDLTLSSSPTDSQKTLGIHWQTATDDLHISTPLLSHSSTVSKRQIVSAVAQIYDPLGWFSPAVMTPRILIQQAWTLHSDWDDPLPDSIRLTWEGWLSEMPELTKHPVHRPYGLEGKPPQRRELHGFSDASEQGFGGAVYLRSVYEDGTCTIDLVAAKGKMAPLQALTIPRLELKGAVVLANLLRTIADDLHIDPNNLYAWSDSTIVLGWLTHSPAQLAVYVGNRIRLIQSTIPTAQWSHVSGVENPADCLSRGLRPADLCHFQLWWSGPTWLALDPEQWPAPISCTNNLLPELRRNVQVNQPDIQPLSNGQTSFTHWVRIVAWIRRFWRNWTRPKNKLLTPYLTTAEYQAAKQGILRVSQALTMPDTLISLKSQKPLPKTNPYRRLTPFIDTDGLVKIGGRLNQAELPETAKHPVILSGKDPMIKLMVLDLHQQMLHPPISASMATISFSFHIPRLKPILKSLTSRCLVCQRKWARPLQQRMGDLPAVRCTKAQVFESVGVDYAGPLYITSGRGRGYAKTKTYVAVFVCMATRAVHLELAADCTTSSFLATLDRFCSRRGTPSRIYSDNGGNFCGGNRELQQALTDLHSTTGEDQVCRWSCKHGLTWHFQPAYAPNHGGLWEAGVKTMKQLIRDKLHHLSLKNDELHTILLSAESVMNSRPYLPLHATDPDGLCPLTPGHFLVGKPLCALPQRVDLSSKLQNTRRWELVKRLQYEHWIQFKRIFLPQLASRAKYLTTHRNLRINDVVLITNADTKRNLWPLGLVIAVFPGPDGLVRAVDVKVETSRNSSAQLATTIYRRSVRHLIRMPITVPSPESSGSQPAAGEYVWASEEDPPDKEECSSPDDRDTKNQDPR